VFLFADLAFNLLRSQVGVLSTLDVLVRFFDSSKSFGYFVFSFLRS